MALYTDLFSWTPIISENEMLFTFKRKHSSIDFSYRFLNDGDDNIWQLSVGANIDA